MTRQRKTNRGPRPMRNAWEPIIKAPDEGITAQERMTATLQAIALLDAAFEGDVAMRTYLTPGPHVHDMALMLARMTDLAVALTRSKVGWEPGRQRAITNVFRDVALHGAGLR